MKDNFSDHSEQYARFRPRYPGTLFDHLFSLLKEKQSAWDCGTGTGQVAVVLADRFREVMATDISAQQLEQAEKRPNILYTVQAAEHTNFISGQFDLITVAQAIHWFSFDAFYTEAKRTLKPDGIIAVIGYGLMQTAGPPQEIIEDFYTRIIGPYWDPERRYIDEGYQTLPFPFEEITMPNFEMHYDWTIDQLLGYLGTWSAVKHYRQQTGRDPIALVESSLRNTWGADETRSFEFPLLLRVGRKG
ncbi:MAG: SAM-dependent methyltransferase [Sediminibacterium sp.]|nr:SAM-dependent methyltransferase [Sediminibacterium sp.]